MKPLFVVGRKNEKETKNHKRMRKRTTKNRYNTRRVCERNIGSQQWDEELTHTHTLVQKKTHALIRKKIEYNIPMLLKWNCNWTTRKMMTDVWLWQHPTSSTMSERNRNYAFNYILIHPTCAWLCVWVEFKTLSAHTHEHAKFVLHAHRRLAEYSNLQFHWNQSYNWQTITKMPYFDVNFICALVLKHFMRSIEMSDTIRYDSVHRRDGRTEPHQQFGMEYNNIYIYGIEFPQMLI